MSVKSALENYSRRHNGIKKARKKNSKPEKETERQVEKWCKENGLKMSIIESKAVYSASAGRYLRGQAEAGHPDMAGHIADGSGVSAYIELKALGKVKNISPAQYDFLKEKINDGCFGCCVDSAELLNKIFYGWQDLRHKDKADAIAYLLSFLPIPKIYQNQHDELLGL